MTHGAWEPKIKQIPFFCAVRAVCVRGRGRQASVRWLDVCVRVWVCGSPGVCVVCVALGLVGSVLVGVVMRAPIAQW